MSWFKDKYGRWWQTEAPLQALCHRCGQPDSLGECSCDKLSEEDVRELEGRLEQPEGEVFTRTLTWVEGGEDDFEDEEAFFDEEEGLEDEEGRL